MSRARSFIAAGIVGAVVWAVREQARQREAGGQGVAPSILPASAPASGGISANTWGKFGQLITDVLSQPQSPVPTAQRTTVPSVQKSASQIVHGVDFTALEVSHGLPRGYMYRTAQIESALNPKAKNPRSSAGGLFQFIDSTARAYGLQDRYDPKQASIAAARLARDNANHLRRVLGREPTAAELYLAHQQGAGGASKLLSNPQGRATSTVGSAAVRLNGGTSNMTNQQFANLWLNKFNRGFV